MKTHFQPLLNITEAAQALGLSKRTLAQLIAERKIGFIKIGRSVRFDHKDLHSFVERQRVKYKSAKSQAHKLIEEKSLRELIAENL